MDAEGAGDKALGLAEIAADDVRSQFGQLIDRVLQGERIVVTRHGRPVLVLVSVDAARRLEALEAAA